MVVLIIFTEYIKDVDNYIKIIFLEFTTNRG